MDITVSELKESEKKKRNIAGISEIRVDWGKKISAILALIIIGMFETVRRSFIKRLNKLDMRNGIHPNDCIAPIRYNSRVIRRLPVT